MYVYMNIYIYEKNNNELFTTLSFMLTQSSSK